jgi:predicted DNA-binding protein (UPF0251 family)
MRSSHEIRLASILSYDDLEAMTKHKLTQMETAERMAVSQPAKSLYQVTLPCSKKVKPILGQSVIPCARRTTDFRE